MGGGGECTEGCGGSGANPRDAYKVKVRRRKQNKSSSVGGGLRVITYGTYQQYIILCGHGTARQRWRWGVAVRRSCWPAMIPAPWRRYPAGWQTEGTRTGRELMSCDSSTLDLQLSAPSGRARQNGGWRTVDIIDVAFACSNGIQDQARHLCKAREALALRLSWERMWAPRC